MLALSFATGLGALPYLIWLIALATTFQLYLRIRNIAEHACTATGGEDPFTHARTTYANWLERATVAPYWVNFHSEHHLFMGVPCYNLPRAHRMLIDGGHAGRMTIARGYADVMRQVITAHLPHERDGQTVSDRAVGRRIDRHGDGGAERRQIVGIAAGDQVAIHRHFLIDDSLRRH